MKPYCENCEYLKDNMDLIDYCIHRDFCEQSYKKGIADSKIISDIVQLPIDKDSIYLFTIKNNIPTHMLNTMCNTICDTLSPAKCVFINEDTVELQLNDYVLYDLKNKFHYKQGDWLLTSANGKTFSQDIKCAMEELLGNKIESFNEYVIFIQKVKEDYRNVRNTKTDKE